MKGRVKWWSNERGYGFIEYEENDNIKHLPEQEKIDSTRDPKEKAAAEKAIAEEQARENSESNDEEEPGFPDFITNLN